MDDFPLSSGPDSRTTDLTSTYISADGFVVHVKAPGGLDGVTYQGNPTEGRDFAFRTGIVSTSGWGEFTLDLSAVEEGGPHWTFAIDPVAKEWSLYRSSIETSELFYWVEPRPFSRIAGEMPEGIEVRVVKGKPTLMINDVDVVTPYGIGMPKMSESFHVGFGAGINPYSQTGHGDTFTVVFGQAELLAIR